MRHRLVSGLCPLLLAALPCSAKVESVDLGGDQHLVRFTFTAEGAVGSVSVAGSFNGWDPSANPLAREGDSTKYTCELPLPTGRYEYKFVIDGRDWRTDAENPHQGAGYQNSILFVGIAPAEPAETTNLRGPVDRADIVDPPDEIARRLATLADAPEEKQPGFANAVFSEHPLPWITNDTVTFVYSGACSAPPEVRVFTNGARLGYALKQVPNGNNLYAVTLARGKFPQRWGYLLAIPHDDRTEVTLDPHGWSATSRSGKPATAGVAASPDRGRVELLPDIKPTASDLPARDIYVYLPPGYAASDERYPVLYMHDGQNCWDDPVEPFGHGGWNVNNIADELISSGKLKPFIVVGISNTAERMTEYAPGRDIFSPDAQPYIRFLIADLKPLIDQKYRTLPGPADTGILGSSMGAIISLQAALLHPEAFGMAGCMSSSLQLKDAAGTDFFDLITKLGKRNVRIYVDSGDEGVWRGRTYSTKKLIAILQENGWQDGVDLAHFTDEGETHNEAAWRKNLPRALEFFFGK